MSDGGLVSGDHDGMACFRGDAGRTILVRNHELSPGENEFETRKQNSENGIPLSDGTLGDLLETAKSVGVAAADFGIVSDA